MAVTVVLFGTPVVAQPWAEVSPEEVDLDLVALETARAELAARRTNAFLVMRNGKLAFEWYADGFGPAKRHYSASPVFLNLGKNYAGARDAFVYTYSHDSDNAYEAADRMVLARVGKDRLADRSAYEFLTGHKDGSPQWSRRIEDRRAVFTNQGRCYRSSISYNPALGRYLWVQMLPDGGEPRFFGGFGIYDAPEPWGL